MRAAVELCLAHGVRVGAHPSYPDRESFGRVSMRISPSQIFAFIVEQTNDLMNEASSLSARVEYIKPHGALYNDAATFDEVAGAVLGAARDLGLPVMCLAGSSIAADDDAMAEGFIDRGYTPEGMLIPRGQPGDLISSAEDAAKQALRLAPSVDSLSVHSDTPGVLELLAAARRSLQDADYVIGA